MKKSQYVLLKRDAFHTFISRLSRVQKVYAPVARGEGSYSFEGVTSGEEVALNSIPTILPAKKFFMPQKEPLLEFDLNRGLNSTPVAESEWIAIFGVRTCDLSGIQCLNMVNSTRPRDFNYLTRKRRISIIGLECNERCDEHSTCTLVNSNLPNGGYDLFFTDMGDHFLVHINTQTGEEIIESTKCFQEVEESHLNGLKLLRERKKEKFKNELPIDSRSLSELFGRSFDSGVWDEIGEKCVGCGNCTNACPTCYCFDVKDEINLDMKTGVRYRVWDSCQLEPFTRVAGGENFRKQRGARQRHRYFRKFRYPVEKYSRLFCTGCGRCSRSCMAGIRLKETLSELIKRDGK